jgi:hypothetical protein
MPRERRDLTGTIIAEKANWSNEEIIAWVDNESKRQEEECNTLQAGFDSNGRKHIENTSRELWGRLEREQARDAERYIL